MPISTLKEEGVIMSKEEAKEGLVGGARRQKYWEDVSVSNLYVI